MRNDKRVTFYLGNEYDEIMQILGLISIEKKWMIAKVGKEIILEWMKSPEGKVWVKKSLEQSQKANQN